MDVVSTETRAIVIEGLKDATPRQAALALLRFGDYLRGLKADGVPLTAELVVALSEELKAIVRADTIVPVAIG